MADYQSLKVPELKKLLNERGLPQTGNKADLIARLQENDKLTSAEEIPAASKKVDDDLIDYEDDDLTKPALVAAAQPSEAPKETAAPANAPLQSESAEGEAITGVAAVQNGNAASAAADASDAPGPADGITSDAPFLPTQNLAPTDAQNEADKRRKRAERFGFAAAAADGDGDAVKTDEAKKLERAERFGLTKDQVSHLDSALPDGPRPRRGTKRVRDHEEEDANGGGADDRAHKRRSDGPQQRDRGWGHGNKGSSSKGSSSKGSSSKGNRRGGDRQQQGKREKASGGKGADPAEKKKMEERAKRFGG
ncbi:hypothetical protein P8C59_006659 [Phyllachora maydis]|uniref:SAP domain-containing protein n=1 Tax=Phyllachora maydis TaxID=1825666 RepID=A0AAD9I8M8_9PEZI|nr:hypothetical protein P8C59_006659 [Phyllachora maydis]